MSDELERIWKEEFVTESRYHPGICTEEMKNIWKTSVTIVSVPTETRTEHFSDANLQRYRYINLSKCKKYTET
jgi:hypothetical protein